MPSSKSTLLASAVPLLAVVAAGAPVASGLGLFSAPDLVIDQVYSIVHVPDGDALARSYIFIDAANAGGAPSGATSVGWTLRDTAAYAAGTAGHDAGFIAGGRIPLRALAAGEPETLRLDVTDYLDGAPTPGAMGRYELTAVADAERLVAESDESNNARTGWVIGGEAKTQ